MFLDDMIYNIAASISRAHTFLFLHYAQIILPQHYLNDNVDVVKDICAIFLNILLNTLQEGFYSFYENMFCHYFHNILL